MRVQEMVEGVGISRPAEAVERGSGITPTTYIPLSVPITTSAITVEMVLTA